MCIFQLVNLIKVIYLIMCQIIILSSWTSSQVEQKQMTPLVKMANDFLIKWDIQLNRTKTNDILHQDGQWYFSEMEHLVLINRLGRQLKPTYLSSFHPIIYLLPISYLICQPPTYYYLSLHWLLTTSYLPPIVLQPT